MALFQSMAVVAALKGKKIASGTVTPTSAAHTVVTGLASVDFAIATAKGVATISHTLTGADIGDQAGTPARGSIIIRTAKPTATASTIPIAATTPWRDVDWVAIGD